MSIKISVHFGTNIVCAGVPSAVGDVGMTVLTTENLGMTMTEG